MQCSVKKGIEKCQCMVKEIMREIVLSEKMDV